MYRDLEAPTLSEAHHQALANALIFYRVFGEPTDEERACLNEAARILAWQVECQRLVKIAETWNPAALDGEPRQPFKGGRHVVEKKRPKSAKIAQKLLLPL